MVGEVKFYQKPLDKKHIREFIGVMKDIQENYFAIDGVPVADNYPRRLEVGVYFSANGFQEEAEKLAYAHGIKTISYENNYLVNRIKELITTLEENFLSVKCLGQTSWGEFRREFVNALCYGPSTYNPQWTPYWNNGYLEILQRLYEQLQSIRTSFIGTSATGVFIHFVGSEHFPEELFKNSDENRCRVYYDIDDFGRRYFWLEIACDPQRRRFYFTPPESLDEASVYGGEIVLNEKQRIFKVLNVSLKIDDISRNLILHIDEDWLHAVRNRNNE